MSEEAFKNSLSPQISVAKALGAETIVLVPGKIGQDIDVGRYNLIVQTILIIRSYYWQNCLVILKMHLQVLMKIKQV